MIEVFLTYLMFASGWSASFVAMRMLPIVAEAQAEASDGKRSIWSEPYFTTVAGVFLIFLVAAAVGWMGWADRVFNIDLPAMAEIVCHLAIVIATFLTLRPAGRYRYYHAAGLVLLATLFLLN